MLRRLFKYAIKEGYRTDNPANDITLWKLGEHRAWTDDECAKFEAHWPVGTMQRRAYALALFTGQRCGDIARMTRPTALTARSVLSSKRLALRCGSQSIEAYRLSLA